MKDFVYEAKKSPTEIVRGTISADSLKSAAEKLGRGGLFLIRIEEQSAQTLKFKRFFNFLPKTASLKDLVRFTQQFADLMSSGLTIVKALDVLKTQVENPNLAAALKQVEQGCIDGLSLSASLERHPDIFPRVFTSLVRSGETSGALEDVMRRYSVYLENQLETRHRIMSALAYPVFMVIMGTLTTLALVFFVIPRMMNMFEELGQSLPLPTLVLISLSKFLTTFWWIPAAALVAAVVSLRKYYKTPEGRKTIDGWTLKLPIFGELFKKIEIARFTNTLATLLANGVTILEALRVASDTLQNRVIRDEVDLVLSAVRGGSSFSKGFQVNSVFPPVVKNMIAVAEESGRLEKTLYKVSEIYDKEADHSVKLLLSLLEPMLILVMGSVVGFIVIAMLLPIFELSFLS